LGFWQLDRAEQKRTLHESFLHNQSGEAISLNRYNISKKNEKNIIWRKVFATGRFDEDFQILLDNQVVNNQAGYFVFTPFQLKNKNIWYLVNRGWVTAGIDRNKLPELRLNRADVLITGEIKYAPRSGIMLAENISEQMQPGVYRLNKIDLLKVAKLLSRPLMPYVIRLNPESKNGYVRDWKIPGSGETLHLGYAFQWFVLAILVFVIYIIVNFKKVQDDKQ
jgi:surfeit locus 1 family protein